MEAKCVFCRIVERSEPASIVCEDERAMAFVDLRQLHPGHTVVIPKRHLPDVRGLDVETGSALMAMVARVTAAVAAAFPNQGLSLWSSIGEAAFQEIPHLHIHVHPRKLDDGLLRVYPRAPPTPGRDVLERYAETIRAQLERGMPPNQ